jgi:hypothetical protein
MMLQEPVVQNMWNMIPPKHVNAWNHLNRKVSYHTRGTNNELKSAFVYGQHFVGRCTTHCWNHHRQSGSLHYNPSISGRFVDLFGFFPNNPYYRSNFQVLSPAPVTQRFLRMCYGPV